MRLTRPYAWRRSVSLLPLYDCAVWMSRANIFKIMTVGVWRLAITVRASPSAKII